MATEAVESQRRRRGAGRNLPAAIGVGLLLGALVIGTLFTYRFGFVILLVLVISGAVWELVRALGRAGAHPPLVPLLAGVLAMDLLAWFRGGGALAVAFLLTALGCVVWRLAEGPTGYLRDVSTAVFVAMYVPFLAGYAVLLAAPDDGARRVVAFIATVVCSDVGGYTAGVLFGRHPMAPTVSPAKSWEGFGGSTVACVAGGIVFLTVLLRRRLVAGRALRAGDRRHRHARRPRRVDDQARPRHQGHGHDPARARRAHGPAGLAAAGRRGVLAAAVRLRPGRLDRRARAAIG